MSSLLLFTSVLVFAQNTTLRWSERSTSTPGATNPASSNFKIVPDTDCHCAKLARTAFSSAVALAAEYASEARKYRTARVVGFTTLGSTSGERFTRSQRLAT